MNPTERMINRIDTVEKFRDIAYLCEDFQTFVDEIQEWGVDHICGVDFFGKGFELNPDLDFKLLDDYFSSFGYTKRITHIPQVGTLSASSGQLKKLSTFARKCPILYYNSSIQTNIHSFKNMLLTKFVEVPNTNIKEEVLSDFGYDLCYDMAQQYGHAQLVWYALNGTRVVEGEYTDKD